MYTLKRSRLPLERSKVPSYNVSTQYTACQTVSSLQISPYIQYPTAIYASVTIHYHGTTTIAISKDAIACITDVATTIATTTRSRDRAKTRATARSRARPTTTKSPSSHPSHVHQHTMSVTSSTSRDEGCNLAVQSRFRPPVILRRNLSGAQPASNQQTNPRRSGRNLLPRKHIPHLRP
jgi:hypothetical protein